jgi:hypothetical protein
MLSVSHFIRNQAKKLCVAEIIFRAHSHIGFSLQRHAGLSRRGEVGDKHEQKNSYKYFPHAVLALFFSTNRRKIALYLETGL